MLLLPSTNLAAGIGHNQPQVVWEPIVLPNGRTTSQAIAMDSRCNRTFYTGARGPGKTDCQLMYFRKHVGTGYGPFWRGIIFDREYKNLDDLVSKANRWFPKFEDGAKWLAATNQYKWVWPTGEELLFRVVKKDTDYWDYHGQEFSFIGWNEITKYPTARLYNDMMSVNRSSFSPEKDTPILQTRRNSKGVYEVVYDTFVAHSHESPNH